MNDKATEILDRLNKIADASEYGYVTVETLKRIIREVMFGKPTATMQIVDGYSWGRVKRVRRMVEEPLTDEQRKTIYKICHRMLDKGVIKMSKSNEMVKPMMTSAEWAARK